QSCARSWSVKSHGAPPESAGPPVRECGWSETPPLVRIDLASRRAGSGRTEYVSGFRLRFQLRISWDTSGELAASRARRHAQCRARHRMAWAGFIVPEL